jgi:hypothetical protein
MTRAARERCVLCGELIAGDEPDAVEVGGGIVHEDCLALREDEGLFGSEPDPATGRAAASFECSVVELARERRERATRTRRRRS